MAEGRSSSSRSRGAALVTGCSSGIGKASALALLAAGYEVYASARRVEDLGELAERGCRVLPLDVTDEGSCSAAVKEAESFDGALAVLVNNAGYGLYGPVEQQPIEQVRRQFETNVFGVVRLCQLALPAMRARRGGRIVNLSSIAGRLAMPGGGFYHGSKFALEALSDAMRMEVVPFGIKVVLVEPGPVRTAWGERAASSVAMAEPGEGEEDDPYQGLKQSLLTWLMSGSDHRAKSVLASSPEQVARVVVRGATAAHPRSRYVVGTAARAIVVVRPFLGDRLWDVAMSRALGGQGSCEA